MRASILDLFPRFYDDRQVASAADHIGDLDTMLIEDGTYFVHEADREIVACGGWSRRDQLYTGSGDAETTPACWIRAPSPRASARCSCAPTGPAAGSGARSSTPARGPRRTRASRSSP